MHIFLFSFYYLSILQPYGKFGRITKSMEICQIPSKPLTLNKKKLKKVIRKVIILSFHVVGILKVFY